MSASRPAFRLDDRQLRVDCTTTADEEAGTGARIRPAPADDGFPSSADFRVLRRRA